jgi:thiJ/pfpI domain protein
MRITGLVPDAMADSWEQVFLSAREEDYMALMEATAAWQNA